MDVQANPEFVDRIRAVAMAVKGVEKVETLWVRKSGLEFFADIHGIGERGPNRISAAPATQMVAPNKSQRSGCFASTLQSQIKEDTT